MKLKTPTTLPEALVALREPGARCLAGGQTLVAMLNARLIEPASLVSLRRIASLATIERRSDGGLRIGAMATHRRISELAPAGAHAALLARAASRIANPPVRQQGTIGGSLCHADPAADYPVVAACVDAGLVIAGAAGERTVPVGEFFSGWYETALRPGEILTAVDVPPAPSGVGAHFEKFVLTEGDFAVVSVAAVVGWSDRRCTYAAIAVGACAGKPVRVVEAEAALRGSELDAAALDAATRHIVDACDPIDDFRASSAYRLRLVPRLIGRAVQAARQAAEDSNV